jgi:uncharacterized protein YbjT (DUF2867 family)
MLIAVTGATGFVGRHIVRTLLSRGHKVRALVRNPGRAASLAAQGVELVAGDLADGPALLRLVDGAPAVIHLVGIILEQGSASFDAVHVAGTEAVVTAARTRGVGRLVHMSAIGARPHSSATRYHRTKWQAEELMRQAGIPCAILRPSVINGPESEPIRTLARLHRWLPVVPVFGRATFPMQPLWIGDVALAFALAAEREEIRGTFELGGPEEITFEAFVRAIGRASGYPRPLVHVPLALVRLLARASDPLGALAPITSSQLRMLVEGSATPANAIESVFGIRPVAFETGLRRFLGKREGGKGEGSEGSR